jgi:hypothetical protein
MKKSSLYTKKEDTSVCMPENNPDELNNVCFLRRSPPEAILRSEVVDGNMIHILYNSLNKEAYTIKDTNKLVWDLLDGKTCVRYILNKLFSIYEAQVKAEDIASDVTTFLEFLWDRNFILTAFRSE